MAENERQKIAREIEQVFGIDVLLCFAQEVYKTGAWWYATNVRYHQKKMKRRPPADVGGRDSASRLQQ